MLRYKAEIRLSLSHSRLKRYNDNDKGKLKTVNVMSF